MGRKAFTPEQIIFKLREVEVLVGQGESIALACRKIAVTEQTYYRWRKEYGGMGDLPPEKYAIEKLVFLT